MSSPNLSFRTTFITHRTFVTSKATGTIALNQTCIFWPTKIYTRMRPAKLSFCQTFWKDRYPTIRPSK
ncbi:hypothetical protein RvY_18632 [Ramazzottius varieornatus]|uniref:Uncharacterized protein n=1 Tax=Ramazzottius varieornatus TaxID=947166 RepID=A0A1D1W9M5_RAMVA|nr:hypothetical protein RvY_18632 [Ramazzottius varieornatus]